MRTFLSAWFVLLSLFVLQAQAQQQQRISGRVTDAEDNSGLPGVTVLVKGTGTGTTTDNEGNYSVQVPSAQAVLQFNFIGYQTREITVGNQTTINIALETDVDQLDEVVVIGFGERRRKDLTGSISTVGSAEIQKIQTASPQFALQGNASGVRVVQGSGDPNEAPRIFVRGIGTWNGDAQPLYVIDGQIFEPPRAGNSDAIGGGGVNTPPNMFNLINPNDIESITVLKDASAAAVYGSRGANGVILITTKKGKKGAPTVELNSRYGVQNIPTYDMLNTQQYVDLTREMYANNLNPDITIENQLYGRNRGNDWQRMVSDNPQFDPESPFYISDRTTYNWQEELVMKNAVNQQHDVKVSGGTDYVDYYLSVGYFQQEGMMYGNDLNRYNATININTDITKWLKVGVNYKYTHQKSLAGGNLVDYADVAPWQPLRDPNNVYGFAQVIDPYRFDDTWRTNRIYGQGSNDNYLALRELNHSSWTLGRQIGQLYAEVSPLEGLTLRGSLNLDYGTQDRYGLNTTSRVNVFRVAGTDPTLAVPTAPNTFGTAEHRINNVFNYQSDFTAIYNRTFGKHNIILTAGVQDQRHSREAVNLSAGNLTNLTDDPELQGWENSQGANNSYYGFDRRFWFGMLGRASYSYNNKYYLDGSYRRDGSNGFDDDYQWGNFYSISGAWRISAEPFMQGAIPFLDDLKIRGGWGQAGNDQAAVGRYAFLSRASGVSSYAFGPGSTVGHGAYIPGSRIQDFPNKELTWEVVTTSYAGFDAYMFRNRLNLTVEFFNRTTDNILQTVNIAPSLGLLNPLFNIGSLENKGVDLQLGFNDRFGDFNFGISGNISFLKNEVTALYANQPLTTDAGRVEIGRSVGHIWGYQVGGMFQNQAEIDEYYAEINDQIVSNESFVAPGDLYFLDIHGNPTDEEPFYSTTPDGRLNSFDQTEIGNTIPGHTYGLNLNAGWKGIDLSFNFYGEGDVDRYNEIRRRFEGMSGAGPNYSVTTLNRWTPQNTDTDMPRAVIGDPAQNNRLSSRWVESAAFFRLNNWQLGYSLPASIMSKSNFISSVRVFVGGQNNLYMFKWSGLDPVNDEYPLQRSYSAGLNVRF